MPQQPFDARTSVSALTGLDFGLRVRVEVQSPQRAIFAGAENLSARELSSELAQLISGLRVHSYALRGQLEQVTHALQVNVASGSWRYARRAALDLAGLLAQGYKRRQLYGEQGLRRSNGALRIAELCACEAR